MEGTKNKLSVCLIVRDEEKFLPESLQSVAAWAEEICVLDTGSRDRSVEIAQSFGARISHFEWCDDFSRARNASLLLARQPWILVLDADERLAPETGPALREAISHPTALAWLVMREDLRPDGPPQQLLLPRLFRNDRRIYFTRPVHEDISDSLFQADAGSPDDCGVRLVHYGYLPEVLATRDKRVRNLAILQAHAQKAPKDLYSMRKLAMSLSAAHEQPQQLEAFEDAYALAEGLEPGTLNDYPFLPSLYEGLASALLRLGRLGRAIAVVNRGLVHFPEALQLMFLRGDLARRCGDRLRAHSYLQACIGRECTSLLCSIGRGLADARPLMALARLAMEAGDLDLAAERLDLAEHHEPRALDIRCQRVRLLLRQSRHRAAVDALHKVLQDAPVHTEVQLLGGELAWQAGNHELAIDLWRAGQGCSDSGNEARARLCVALLATGHEQAALQQVAPLVARDLTSASCRALFASLDSSLTKPDTAFEQAPLLRGIRTWMADIARAGRSELIHKLAGCIGPDTVRSCRPPGMRAAVRPA